MDPKIWGNKLWNIFFDLSWALDRKGKSLSQKSKKSFSTFFESMQHLMPCSYCRQSYCVFTKDLAPTKSKWMGPPCGSGALKWTYNLKNKVNDKLHRQDFRPSYECLERRMRTWSSASSANDIWDILTIFALNDNENQQAKTKWMKKLFGALPDILVHLPEGAYQAQILRSNPPTDADFKTNSAMLDYLCFLTNGFSNGVRTPGSMAKQFSHCKAQSTSRAKSLRK